jgi:BirA family biotin operon repressor/biotin-[acetyl-CoA-carboxylase] ligase
MRRAPTSGERLLWQALRKHQVGGAKFRRQVPLGPDIADFYCAAAKLVVEVDGDSHIDLRTDATRDEWMIGHGLRVFRILNEDVMRNLGGVVLAIQQAVAAPPPPDPLPRGEGELL